MGVENKFLLRKNTGDQPIAGSDLRDWFQKGQCKAADFIYDFSTRQWVRLGDHPAMALFFSEKPALAPDRRVIYFLTPGGTAAMPQGPFSTKEIQQRAQLREICSSTWVFVEGDKEWRQVKSVKILNDMLPPLPSEQPPEIVAVVAAEIPTLKTDIPSIKLDLGIEEAAQQDSTPALASGAATPPEREEMTLAMDTMGLNLHSELLNSPPSPPKLPQKQGAAPSPSKPSVARPSAIPQKADPEPSEPPRLTLESNPSIPKPKAKEGEPFNGIVAEIPMDPIWLVKQANSEVVSGPFRFLEVIKYLEEGKLTKNDKIARSGTKAFTKIQQQYEFNVKYSIENVMENGQEKQKILIRRRHPRVPYMTGVQIMSRKGLLAGNCVNISAGGILMEAPKAEFSLGESIEVKILPGLIAKSISCRALIIGKIPKIPPGFALKFEDLKLEDKEAIEYYVQETLKREMSKKN